MAKCKQIKGMGQQQSKRVVQPQVSSDNEKMIWVFSAVDVDGIFRIWEHTLRSNDTQYGMTYKEDTVYA